MYEKLIIITTLQQLPLRVSKVQWLHFIGAVDKVITACVKFFRDAVYEKLLKLVHFGLSY